MKNALPLLAALAALGLGAGAAHAASQPQACFRTSDVTGWRATGTKSVIIQTNNRELYRLRFDYDCDALKFAGERIGFNKTGPGPACSGIDVDVLVRGMTCPVKAIHKLSKAEVASLPNNAKP